MSQSAIEQSQSITAQPQAESALDSLTGLQLRAAWKNRVQQLLDDRVASLVILFIDLDRFKWINDALGHGAGDSVLRHVASLMERQLQPQDFAGRIGGDEFVICLQHPQSIKQAELFAQNLIAEISQPMALADYAGQEVEIGASIGLSRYPIDSDSLEVLLQYADLAMYRAKHSGRNQMVSFQPEMLRQIEYRRHIQALLRQALREDLLALQYTPIIDCRSNQVVAIEAQLLAESPSELAQIDSESLFALAEDSQVAVQLSQWILCCALSYLQRLSDNLQQLQLVVSVRPSHFRQKDFVDELASLLESFDIAAERLVLNLNESCLNTQRFEVQKQLQALSKIGVQLAVDNFGVGSFSALRLHDWPIDRLNLSSVFVTELTNKRSMEAMAIALIQMGHTLAKEVVAYGVQTLEQQAVLRSQQCYLMQGIYLSDALDSEQMEALLLEDYQPQSLPDYLNDELDDK